MQFMILIYSSQASEAAVHAEAHDDFRETHNAVISELSALGELVETRELSVLGAKIVSTRNGLSIVDGPHIGAEEWVSGYYLVNVADEKRVHGIAARLVEARYATVETRRLE
ncbi:YciI family protein [Salinibacterium sp. CAN_S4]|uniref:YciI family protein n=1 Tax=Salinibacterium sp. CAN_S4 TaxID=2787727 RepID=UPI002FF0C166